MSKQNIKPSIWGNYSRDWSEIQEKQGVDGYEFVLEKIKNRPIDRMLDVGCGSGYFCSLANDKGYHVCGIDTTESFINEAVIRVPNADFIISDMADIPFCDDTFDVVCGFNSFQYATNLKKALAEAVRVLRPNGLLAILVWGKSCDCNVITILDLFATLVDTHTKQHLPFMLSEDDTLENQLTQLCMQNIQTFTVPSYWRYPDKDTSLRGILSLGAAAKSIAKNGIEKVKHEVSKLLENYQYADNSIVIQNQYRIIMATKSQT